MYFSASRPNNFTASLGSTETSALARLVVLLPLVLHALPVHVVPVLVASVWANLVSAGANASAPEAKMNTCSAVAAAAQILRVMFDGDCARKCRHPIIGLGNWPLAAESAESVKLAHRICQQKEDLSVVRSWRKVSAGALLVI